METKEYFEKGMFFFRIPPSPFSQKELFRKPTFNSLYDPFGSPYRGQKPSLPLRKAPPFSPSLSSIVFTPPSVPPVLGDRNPQGREDVAGSAIAPPEFWSASGACALKGWLECLRNKIAIIRRNRVAIV